MKKYVIWLMFLFPIFIYSQNIPENLNECYLQIDSLLKPEDIKKIKDSEDQNIMNQYHMNLGLYIRNNWIRNVDQKLIKEINYKPWEISIDDISGIILTGYWYYLHNKPYEWSGSLNASEKYYKSYDEPTFFPENIILEKQNVMYFIENIDFTEMVHVYKNKDSFYLYTHSNGWKKLSLEDYNKFRESKNKIEILLKSE